MITFRALYFRIFFVVIFLITGCEQNSFRAREIGALTGAALGAGLGAIVGNQVGHSGGGIAIGSAAGALAGGLVGQSVDSETDRLDEQQGRISEQQRQLEENRKLLNELKNIGADARISDRGVVVNLPDVLFQFDSAKLTGGAQSTVREISAIIRNGGGLRQVAVEGHTDSVGTVGYNQRLSEDRAQSVSQALADYGVNKRLIKSHGLGEDQPIASNDSAAGRSRNRRVEVILMNEKR